MRPLDPKVKRDLLHRTPLFAALRPAELDELLAFTAERRFPRDSSIFQRGEAGGSLMVLVQGRLRIGAVSAEGKEVTIDMIEPGGVVGELALLDGKPRSADVMAMEDSTVVVVERRDFLPFVGRNPDLLMRLLVLLCERLRRTNMALEEVALLNLPARLARVLVKLGQEYGATEADGTRIRLRLSQKDLSTLVATTRESVNKQLRQWRADGVLDETDGHIIIRRLETLRGLMA